MALRTVTRRFGSKFLPMFSSTNLLHSHATSFGFKEVPEEEKSRLVGNVFTNVASNYDLMNDLMSAGLHRLWKDRLVSELNPFPGMKHLDVAGGTGDVAFRILESINDIKRRAMQDVREDDLQEETQIYVCDVNPNMLNVGKNRAIERGLGEEKSLIWVEGDAEALSFQDNSMDGYTIAFGIRNVTHIEKALDEAYRVLKRGGRFLCLELSHVEAPVFKELNEIHSKGGRGRKQPKAKEIVSPKKGCNKHHPESRFNVDDCYYEIIGEHYQRHSAACIIFFLLKKEKETRRPVFVFL